MVESYRPPRISAAAEDTLTKATRRLSPGQADHIRTVVYDAMVHDCGGVENFLESLKARDLRGTGETKRREAK